MSRIKLDHRKLLQAGVLCLVFLYGVFYLVNINSLKGYYGRRSGPAKWIFEGFDNETGSREGCFIVPNYVHFVRFGTGNVTFPEAVCLLAAFKHQRPERLYIHTDVRLRGLHWERVVSTPGFKDVLVVHRYAVPKSIYGQRLNYAWRRFHGGDITRLRMLMKYGGIFLDNDSYIVQSLDHFRQFEMAIGWEPGKSLGNQVLVAHKDARFLQLWLESYRGNYNRSSWYYNAGDFPTTILQRQPWLVHRVPKLFGVYGVLRKIFQYYWPDWRSYYALHLLVRHQSVLHNVTSQATYPVEFTDINIHKYPITFREMAYDVYPFTTIPTRKETTKNYKQKKRKKT